MSSVGSKATPEAYSSGKIASQKKAAPLSLLLALATLAVFYPAVRFSFLNYDDKLYVSNNLYVQSGLEWDTVQWAFTTFHAANWHPVTWLSHALDCQLFQLNPAGPHAVNLALHVINSVLLLWVLFKATGYLERSAMVAALFALHPINVQSVAWVAERKNLLSMFFFLLALGAYRWYARQPRPGAYSVVAVLYALGLMAKPQVITLPLVLLLWDYWPLGRMFDSAAAAPVGTRGISALPSRRFLALLREKVPLLIIAAGSAWVTMKAQASGGAVRHYPSSIRLENALVSYVRYLGHAVYPAKLAAMYPHPAKALLMSYLDKAAYHGQLAAVPPNAMLMLWQALAALVFLGGVTAYILTNCRRRYLVVGWLWFVGTLVPMIGLVQVGVQSMADRYAYLPFIGLFIMVCWGISEWAANYHVKTVYLAGSSVAALLLLSAVTRRELEHWKDSISLWSHTLQVTTRNYVAEDNLGEVIGERGDFEEAMKHFRAAVDMEPLDPLGNLYLGRYEQMQRNLPQAIEHYKKTLVASNDPKLKARALSNMGYAYRDLGDEVRARACLEAADSTERNHRE